MKRVSCRLLPAFFSTVTIFNQAFTGGRTVWYKTIVDGCFVQKHRGAAAQGADITPADSFTVRIPAHPACIARRDWEALTDKNAAFTLAPGDVCILGEAAEGIADDTSPSGLLRQYDGFVIRGVSENCAGPLAHWKLTGV